MPTDNQSVKPREANELYFVVECFILRQNKFAYWLQLHVCEAVRPHQGYASKQKKELPGS